ncbi:MAG TPA: DUF4350 domain-containing protein [Thermoanaerobaculia bacterium]|nr:DUF4350 domain-containing protein [Thermoanaerobaculia bacterium]
MRGRGAVLLTLAVLSGSLVLLVTLGRRGAEQVGPSSLAAGSEGWLVARRYLEARGTEVELWDRPPTTRMPGGTFVLTFPALKTPADETDALVPWVERGGRLILGLSGRFPAPEELSTLLGFGLFEAAAASEGRGAGGEVLEPVGAVTTLPGRLESGRLDWLPDVPEGAEVLYRRQGDGAAAVWRLPRGGGEILVLPASLFANGRLHAAGNADWLESLRQDPRGPWFFDELHHGLVAAEVRAAAGGSSAGFDLFGLHVLLLYALGLSALARRFGASWREAPLTTGSVGQFLTGLGRLHHELGHHGEAARLLAERSRELDPRLELPPDTLLAGERAEHPRDLMAVASAVARARKGEERPR